MTGELRDDRAKGWFHLDNVVVDVYLPLVGHTAFVVYAYVVRNVNNDRGYAWPSYTKIQKDLGLGRNQVAESVKRLEEHGLLRVDRGERAAVNHYYITTPGSLAGKLVSEENQSRSETETSFPQKPKLVSERDSIKTYLKRPNEKDRLRESVRPSRSITRAHEARFSPANHSLTEEEIAADAAASGTTPEKLLAIIPQWADSRSSSGGTSRDWRADLRKFARSYLEREPTKATGSARASPKSFTAIKLNETIEGMAAWNAQMDEQEQASGTHHLQSANGPTEHRLRPGTERAAPVHVLGSGTKPSR